eukprot:CAMPEP_0175405536 /NCGR_PEP_ID=MMETSP0095-20121207/39102_1 /TAXON_ID=311494 /ORGANISM="Alexandrium monilatum, Strain CCMP3105" /LENGTH=232 /DNA_ID=CAMNT_0016704375 /DNA_START=730 /DNA_END=1427 /DNA_ORIENTATION=-
MDLLPINFSMLAAVGVDVQRLRLYGELAEKHEPVVELHRHGARVNTRVEGEHCSHLPEELVNVRLLIDLLDCDNVCATPEQAARQVRKPLLHVGRVCPGAKAQQARVVRQQPKRVRSGREAGSRSCALPPAQPHARHAQQSHGAFVRPGATRMAAVGSSHVSPGAQEAALACIVDREVIRAEALAAVWALLPVEGAVEGINWILAAFGAGATTTQTAKEHHGAATGSRPPGP